MKIIYETDRLIIREWELKDKEDLYEYASDPIVTKYLTFPTYLSTQEAEDRIAYLLDCYKTNNFKQDYAIELKSEQKVIGAIGIVNYTGNAEGIAEIGYVLTRLFQGNGYMTEALKGMFKYIKEHNIAKRITAEHDTENIKSGNVMKRAGMTFEGIKRKAGKNNLHSRHDLAVYSILYEEI